MQDSPPNTRNKRVIWRCRVIAWLLPPGSLAILLVALAATAKMGIHDLLVHLRRPLIVLLLALFYLIYIPASLRIYYILLLNTKGVFTAIERRKYQDDKQKWDRYLLRASIAAGIAVILLIIIKRFPR